MPASAARAWDGGVMAGEMCGLCRNTGWVLEARRDEKGALDLLPCLIPDCEHSGKTLEVLGLTAASFRGFERNLGGKFTAVTR